MLSALKRRSKAKPAMGTFVGFGSEGDCGEIRLQLCPTLSKGSFALIKASIKVNANDTSILHYLLFRGDDTVEGRVNDGYIWDRLVRQRQGIQRLARSTLPRLRRLTIKKLANHLMSLLYKSAILLVIMKPLEAAPQLQAPELPIEFRFLNRSDTGKISALNGLSKDRIAEFYAEGSRCLGAFFQDKLVAFSWCHYRDHHFPFFGYCLEVGDGVYIGPDYVDAEFRGHRIHGHLLTRLFEHLYREGCRTVWSSVLKNNHASIKGLKRAGFIPHQQIEVTRIFKTIACKRLKLLNHWP